MIPGLIKKGSILVNFINNFIFSYKSPGNLSYMWNFGFLALLCLFSQILSGIFLAMYYISDVNIAFSSIEYINRNVNSGWFIRYIHSNGASMFFIVIYIHMLKGLYYSSFTYPRQFIWISGILIWLLMIITSFLGYVLPWGQMSYWAATVIIKLMSSIPIIGIDIVYWLWGGFSVNQATLTRFFSFHFFLPFIIFSLSFIHMIFLHEFGSNNPLGISSILDDIFLHPHFVIKDSVGLNLFVLFSIIFIFFYPNILGHPDNYIFANPLITPNHIVPEWYLLPFYAILRSIPNKLLGVIFMILSILGFIALPFILGFSKIRSFSFKPLHKMYFFLFVLTCFYLGCIGGLPVVSPYYELGQLLTISYFMIFVNLPLLAFIEFLVYELQKIKNKK